MDLAISTEGLTRDFPGGRAVDGLTLEVPAGEVLALLGPNGAGKTTTVRLLDGVLTPHAGSARVLGLNPATEGHRLRRRTGVLTEQAGLDERLTTRENLEFTARLRGDTPTEASTKTAAAIDRFGLGEVADRTVQGFSTGQRKRVALARALLNDPEVLFLDEPTSGLDPAATREVIALIDDLADEGRTVVLCTHFLGEAGRLADRMAVMHRGRLQALGTPAELAAGLFAGIEVDIDLGGPPDRSVVDHLSAQRGVTSASTTATGLLLNVEDREVVPLVVADLVGRGLAVYGANPRPPTLEDVYFAISEGGDGPGSLAPDPAPLHVSGWR